MSRVSRCLGASLVELIVTIVVISLALSGVLIGVDRITRQSADPMVITQSRAIANAYLEEILPKDYADPSVTGAARDGDCSAEEGGRSAYDDVGDYDGLSESPPRDQTGTALTDLGGYQASVSVACNQSIGPSGNTVTAKIVTVTVTNTGLNTPVELTGYRSDI
ncbi:pilus assembly protein MshD [Ectothiorhodospiraceae bacterium WFHF3C12]|nr:pilus assembly protein MshD [Ectothiorhodospiraceae bacterium WFHF3C12]